MSKLDSLVRQAGHQHFAFGLRILSDVSVPGLHPYRFDGRPDVVLRLALSPQLGDDQDALAAPFTALIHLGSSADISVRSNDQVVGIRFRDDTEFVISKCGGEIWARWPPPLTLEDATTYLLGPIFSLLLRLRGTISLHASAVRIGDVCVALVGPQGAGKSTTAASFATAGYSVLTDDLAPIEDKGDNFNIVPSYPGVRLWEPSVEMLFGTNSALPRITPTWDKRFLELGTENHSFEPAPVPLAAIYFLHPRTEDPSAPVIHQEPARDGLIKLVGNIGANYVLDQVAPAATFDLLQRISRRVPLRRLLPSADPDRLPQMRDMVVADVKALQADDPSWREVQRQGHV